ncbi:YesK family protein [Solibacillus sp. R5-41]|uniref:YesK family protein n=1 Tax=Solibacillus sp. R5-41 TaxID=2048654 RepID=UPI0012FE6ADB|nr:YesK family protein [Solibacillus sp. R5-41]
MATIIIFGFFIGILIFLFSFAISKINGHYYLAPLVTFAIAIFVVFYSIFKVGGFEGMGYGIIGVSIFVVAVIGTLILPLIVKQIDKNGLNKFDKSILIISPFLLFASIIWVINYDDGYWVISEGFIEENKYTAAGYYTTTTISEGMKKVKIQLGEAYEGKQILVEKVKTIGNTEVIIKIIDGGKPQKMPFIEIGLQTIVEPFVVKTTDGEIIESVINVPTK